MIRKNIRYVKKWSYKNFNPEAFSDDVARVKWWDIYQCDDVDKAVNLFQESLLGSWITMPQSRLFKEGHNMLHGFLTTKITDLPFFFNQKRFLNKKRRTEQQQQQ